MASKFYIEIKFSPMKGANLVRVIDVDQDENTGWCQVALPHACHEPDQILAHACQQHEYVHNMLQMAGSVAYAVYLNDKHFDVHEFLPSIDEIISRSAQSLMDSETPRLATPAPPGRRM